MSASFLSKELTAVDAECNPSLDSHFEDVYFYTMPAANFFSSWRDQAEV
jgi:hypothetical protein